MPTRFSIMTYNVHSCIGRDGLASPERVAEIIALYGADVICMQELDSGLPRTGREHQAREIADRLNMDFHFHPSFKLEEGEYGNAVLTRFRSEVVRAMQLPTLPGRTYLEKRGALWIRVYVGDRPVNVLTTHLGLSRVERVKQAEALLGPDWLGDPQCVPPFVLCGDFNTVPHIGVYRRFAAALKDASSSLGIGRGRTWPSGFPFMRLDHVFVSAGIMVQEVKVPRTRLTRMASDHLPLVAVLDTV